MAKQDIYSQYIGQFFPHIRLDLTFFHSNKNGRNDYSIQPMDYYYRWIDSRKGVLLVKRSHVYIDGEFATQFQITMEIGQYQKVTTKTLEILNAYIGVYDCPVLTEQIPMNSYMYVKENE